MQYASEAFAATVVAPLGVPIDGCAVDWIEAKDFEGRIVGILVPGFEVVTADLRLDRSRRAFDLDRLTQALREKLADAGCVYPFMIGVV